MDYDSIPGRKGYPFIGNLFDIKDPQGPLLGFNRLAETYGPVVRSSLFGKRTLLVSDAKIMQEVLDEKRFFKIAIPGLSDPKRPRGLIVAGTMDPDWQQGRRILRPAFGPIKVDEMFAVHSWVLKWARVGSSDDTINVAEDPSILALDTVTMYTGLAPFRGFVEQRACQLQADPETVLAPAHLFIGCRSPSRDRLYASELDSWAELGAVELHYAYSCEQVRGANVIVDAWASGARAFICGNPAVSASVGRAARELVEAGLKVRRERDGWSEEDVEARKRESVEGC